MTEMSYGCNHAYTVHMRVVCTVSKIIFMNYCMLRSYKLFSCKACYLDEYFD